MKDKKKKILNTVVNVIVILIAIIVLIIAISSIASIQKGYNSYFGYAAVSVRTNSMEGNNPDSFNAGDMLFVQILDESEKKNLQIGDVISFWDRNIVEGKKELNTHRIVDVNELRDANGDLIAKSYVTKGDNNPAQDSVPVVTSDVVGKYTGNRAAGFGAVTLFIQSSTGFLCLVVVPALLLLIYAIVRLIVTVISIKKEKRAKELEAAASISDEERERIRTELLAELEQKKQERELEEKR